jgi:hypothetical protein
VRIRFLKLSEDFTWDNVEAAGWSIGELCSGLTCACLPTFRPLVGRWFPALSTRNRSNMQYYANNKGSSYNTEMSSKSRDRDRCKHNRDLSSSGSNNGLFCKDTKYDLERADSGDNTDNVLGLHSAREDLRSQAGQEASSGLRENSARGLVTTEIVADPHGTTPRSIAKHLPIQVKCDIVQTSSPRIGLVDRGPPVPEK